MKTFVILIIVLLIPSYFLMKGGSQENKTEALYSEDSRISDIRRSSNTATQRAPRPNRYLSERSSHELTDAHINEYKIQAQQAYGNLLNTMDIDVEVTDQIVSEIALANQRLSSTQPQIFNFQSGEIDNDKLKSYTDMTLAFSPTAIMERYLDQEQFIQFLEFEMERHSENSEIVNKLQEDTARIIRGENIN